MAQTWLTAKPVSREVLQAHLLPGKAWAGFRIPGKLAYRFMTALGRVHQDAWKFLASLRERIDYRTSTELLEEWETSVGLPDKCLPRASSVSGRRDWIKFRLDKTRWNTLADWEAIAILFGVSVKITPGYRVQEPSLYRAVFPIPIRKLPALGRFRIYIDLLDQSFGGFPYDGQTITDHKFPIPFVSTVSDFEGFQCFIQRIAPANVLIVWNEFPAIPPNGNGLTFSDDFDEEFS